MQLTLITYNIHHGKGSDGILNVERIAMLLKSNHADLIGLNEVDSHFSMRSNYMDQPYLLSERLGMNYVFGPSISLAQTKLKGKEASENSNREYGNVLLSPHPIIQSDNHIITSGRRFLENRSLLEATVRIRDIVPIKVYIGHFSLQKSLRKKQIQFAKEKIQVDLDQDVPIVLMGDFNMAPTNKMWNEQPSLLQDAWKKRNTYEKRGATFPSRFPVVRLDYILTSNQFNILSADVIQTDPKASDHLPLVVTANVKIPES